MRSLLVARLFGYRVKFTGQIVVLVAKKMFFFARFSNLKPKIRPIILFSYKIMAQNREKLR
jgi:hypothetical protein